MKKFVWDTSALIDIKQPDQNGYSPGLNLMKNLYHGWIKGSYVNIYPALAVFELNAAVSRMHREGKYILRDYYIMNVNSFIYQIDRELIYKCKDLFLIDGFSSLRGADLVFACIAYVEGAFLVTKDKDFSAISKYVRVIDLNGSEHSAIYHDKVDGGTGNF